MTLHFRTALVSLIFWSLLGFSLLSCGSSTQTAGTEIGNPNSVALQIVGIQPSDTARLSVRTQSGVLSFSKVEIVVSEISFVPFQNGDCDDDDAEIEFEGPYVVDLLSNTSRPELEETQIPSGVYCEIEFEMQKLTEEDRPQSVEPTEEILNRSIFIQGETPNGKPFQLMGSFDQEFELESDTNGILVSSEGTNVFYIAFHLGQWFANVDFDSAVKTGEVIMIDEDRNPSIFQQIKSNIETSAELLEDFDGSQIDNGDDDDD